MYGRKLFIHNSTNLSCGFRNGFRCKKKIQIYSLKRCNSSSTSKPVSSAFWLSRIVSSVNNLRRNSKLFGPINSVWDNLSESTSQTLQNVLKFSKLVIHKNVKDVPSVEEEHINSSENRESHSILHSTKGIPEADENVDKPVEEFIKEQEREVKKALVELENKHGSSQKPTAVQKKKTKAAVAPPPISQRSLESRSKFLLTSLLAANSPSSQLTRLEELNKHLLQYPESQCFLVKERAVSHLLRLRENTFDDSTKSVTRQTLSLLGYTDPPKGRGINILSIDGGGIRGILAIEVLKHFEAATGKRIHELFDVISGVSTGAILSLLLGGQHCPLDECETLYRKMSWEIFQPSSWLGTGRLVWSHSYYDTAAWTNMLKSVFQETNLNETTRIKDNPKIAAISAVMNQPTLQAYVFRNYNLPYRVTSHFAGSCKYKMWQAIRASGAAPGYFEEFEIDGNVHQDGGLLINNPTAVAIHEAKLLWPGERIQCVVSLGCGRYIPPPQARLSTSTSLKTKILKVIDSATDTESVHTVLQDLLPSYTYYRINPYLSERVTLDESRAEKLDQLILDAQLYLRRNEDKLTDAVQALTTKRNPLQRIEDWCKLKFAINW